MLKKGEGVLYADAAWSARPRETLVLLVMYEQARHTRPPAMRRRLRNHMYDHKALVFALAKVWRACAAGDGAIAT